MSILLSTVFPIALSGIALPAASAAAPVPAAAPFVAPVATPIAPPAKALPKPVPVKVAPPFVAPKPRPAIVTAPAADLIPIQAPAPKQTAPSAADRAAIVDRVSKAFTEVRTAQGKFTQVAVDGGVSSGSFFINRPGKIRFDYNTPEPMHIVSDGTTVSIEEPKRKAYDAVPLSSTPLHLFLRSSVDLKRDGSVTDVTTQGGSHLVTLVDKTGEAQGKMILEFRASDFELLGWRAIEGDGAETRVRLSDTKTNVSLSPSLFVVRDPNDLDRRR